MKKYKKICLVFAVLMAMFTFSSNTYAEAYGGSLYDIYHPDSGFTVFAEEKYGNMDYNSWIIKSDKDTAIYYCIDPALALGRAPAGSFNLYNYSRDIIGKSGLTQDKYNKVLALAYHGYGYPGHTDKKWYGITQVMIWRVMRPDLTWTFKKDRNSPVDKDLYKEEINEMNELVSEYQKEASFADKDFKVLLGSSIALTDTNKVVHKHNIGNSLKYTSVKRNGDSITITGLKQGKETYNFSYAGGTGRVFSLYTSNTYQDIISKGDFSPMPNFQIRVEVVGGTVNLSKNANDENLYLGESTLEGATYQFYNLDEKSIGKIITDKNGKGSLILDYGTYKVKETKAPVGYELNDEIHEITLDKNNTEIPLNVTDNLIKGEVIINKTKGGTGDKYLKEEGAVFDVYDKNDSLIDTVITDKNGEAKITLPYGTYNFKQTKGVSGYVLTDDFSVAITKSKTYKVSIKNTKLSMLKLHVKDSVTKGVIPDTLVEVYNDKDEIIICGKTDKNGLLEVPNLEIGKYYVKEKSVPKTYILNEEKTFFEVLENGTIIELEIFNERITGSLIFYKKDEKTLRGLEDAYIKIISSEKIEKNAKTNKDGIIRLENLRADEYCIYEEKAPEGYEKTDKPLCFEITDNKKPVSVVMTNKKLLNVPNTMKNKNITISALGIITVLFGTFLGFYVKKEN